MLYLTPRIAEAGKVHWCKPFCKIKDVIKTQDKDSFECMCVTRDRAAFICMNVRLAEKESKTALRHGVKNTVTGLNIHWSIKSLREKLSLSVIMQFILHCVCIQGVCTGIQIRRWLWGWGRVELSTYL